MQSNNSVHTASGGGGGNTKPNNPSIPLNLRSDLYPDPYSHMTVTCLQYPEEKSQSDHAQNRFKKRNNRRTNLRYKTQPVTLIEIKETEEDNKKNTTN